MAEKSSYDMYIVDYKDKDTREAVIKSLKDILDTEKWPMVKGARYSFGSDVKLYWGLPFDGAEKETSFVVTEEGRKICLGLSVRHVTFELGDGSGNFKDRVNDGTFMTLLASVAREVSESKDEAGWNQALKRLSNVKFKVTRAEKQSYTMGGVKRDGYFYTLSIEK